MDVSSLEAPVHGSEDGSSSRLRPDVAALCDDRCASRFDPKLRGSQQALGLCASTSSPKARGMHVGAAEQAACVAFG